METRFSSSRIIIRPRYEFRRSFDENSTSGLQFRLNRRRSGTRCHEMLIKKFYFPPSFPPLPHPLLVFPRLVNDIRDEKTDFSLDLGLSHYERQIAVYVTICGLPYGITNVARKLMIDAIGFTLIILHTVWNKR